MAEHPIQGLMQTAMENIKGMVDVNTIVGDPVNTPDGALSCQSVKWRLVSRRR